MNQDSNDDVLFRVLVFREQINGRKVEIRIAKPIEDLEEELIALVVEIGIGLLLCALIIFHFRLCPCWPDIKADFINYRTIQRNQ